MIKYRVTIPNETREFQENEYSTALLYATNNNVSVETITFEPIPPEVHLPDVTPRQFRQALVLSNISIATIEAAINALPSPQNQLAFIEWEYSTAFIRSNPLVNSIGTVMGLTKEQIDDVWRLARTL